jgi:hypothetical protein
MINARINVTKLAMITGQAWVSIPYTNQNDTPATNNKNMASERSLVECVFQTRMTCGRNETVVKMPPTIPIALTRSNVELIQCNPRSIDSYFHQVVAADIPFYCKTVDTTPDSVDQTVQNILHENIVTSSILKF